MPPTPQRQAPLYAFAWPFLNSAAHSCAWLFDHLIRLEEERRGDRQAERLGGLEIEDQLEGHGPFDGQVGGLGPFEELIYEHGAAPVETVATAANEAGTIVNMNAARLLSSRLLVKNPISP